MLLMCNKVCGICIMLVPKTEHGLHRMPPEQSLFGQVRLFDRGFIPLLGFFEHSATQNLLGIFLDDLDMG